MDEKGGLQLIPETKRSVDIKRPGENKLLFISIAILAILVGAGFGMSVYKKSFEGKIAEVDNKLLELEQKRNKTAEAQLKTFSGQSRLMTTLIDGHTYWSKAFANLEKLFRDQVQIISFSGELGNNKLTITALTFSYTTIAKQIASFLSDDSFKDITLGKVTSRPDGKLEFNLTIDFDPDKFVRQK